jgi:hypothetical protein
VNPTTSEDQAAAVPDFAILPGGLISDLFLGRNLTSFTEAARFVRALPYRRNSNKDDLASVLSESCGTCGTKHALLKMLADENGQAGIRLILGIFRMDGNYARTLQSILEYTGLPYIPEAHTYLRWGSTVLDYTREGASPEQFLDLLLEETEIGPSQVSGYKEQYHRRYLEAWLLHHPEITISNEELWQIRERCIHKMSGV